MISSTNEIEAKSTMQKGPRGSEESVSFPLLLTEAVSSRKSTAVHEAVIRSRDEAFQVN